jgi:hypothetical protein
VKLPQQRGPLSAALLDVLLTTPGGSDRIGELPQAAATALAVSPDLVSDGDVQLALFCLNALHYGGLAGVDEGWEWDPTLIAMRSAIEQEFEAVLRERVPVPSRPSSLTADAVANTLFEMAEQDKSPGLSRFVASKATHAQLLDFMIQRSIYTLREADAHTWAIPRLDGRAKAALVEIQADEYGGGRPERMHSELFAVTMRGLGLDGTYGGYVDLALPVVLASVNMMSMFGLHRRLRGAIVGHLAAFEITSSAPNRRYANAFRRLGHEDLTEYFDEHVEADAVHEQIAARDLAGGLVEAEPHLVDDVLFGAAACLVVDSWVTEAMQASWTAQQTPAKSEHGVAA